MREINPTMMIGQDKILQFSSDGLGVSDATIRNWNRLGVSEGERSAKLMSRANKQLSEKSFQPAEYTIDSTQSVIITQLVQYAGQHRLDHSTVLFFAASSLTRDCQNPFLVKEIQTWEDEITAPASPRHKEWFDRILPMRLHGDFLGLLYQSLLSEGKKAKSGSYYTPPSVARAMLENHCSHDNTVLDPACGTGQFLLEAANIVGNPKCLYGIDNDPIAVRIARLNLMMRFPDRVFEPKIFHADTLLQETSRKENNQSTTRKLVPKGTLAYASCSEENDHVPFGFFDLVVTNPPWGSHWTKQEKIALVKNFPQILSGESFSYFLVQATKFAKKGGVISFLLPESILNIKVHSDIRDYLSKHFKIRAIQNLGRLFTGVFTPVIRLDVVNDKPRPSAKTDGIFAIFQNADDRRILQKIESCPTWNLKDNAQFALGIVTGNNDRHLLKTPLPGCEPIFRGKDVEPFFLKQNAEFIVFQPEKYQQVAPEQLFRADEKLIYRFISKDMVFAYDDCRRLTLNSANVLIPTRPDFSIKVLCAVLNSDLMRFVYRKKFNALKVLRGNLEALLLPDFSQTNHQAVLSFVDEFIETKNKTVLDEINRLVYRYFEVGRGEIRHIARKIEEE